MHLSRRKMIAATGATALAARAGIARANALEQYWDQLRPRFARHWTGGGIAQTGATESGKLMLVLEVDFNPQSDMRIDGTLRMKSRWQTGTYEATYGIRGYCWGDGNDTGVRIEETWLRSADSLPEGLFWQGLTGSLQFYHESGTDDHWLFKGWLSGTQDGLRFETQLSDH